MTIHSYTKTGSYHERLGGKNQDFTSSLEGEDYLAILLADGATACRCGLEGARLACKAAEQIVTQEGFRFFSYPPPKIAYLLTEHILHALEQGKRPDSELCEYGSTLALAFLEKKSGRTVAVNLGDGAVYAIQKEGATVLLRPKRIRRSPCLTTTQGAAKAVEVAECRLGLGDSILIGSDGFLERLRFGQAAAKMNAFDLAGLDQELDSAENADDCSYITFQRERK